MNPLRESFSAFRCALLGGWLALAGVAQAAPAPKGQEPQGEGKTVQQVAADLQQQLADATAELASLRERIAGEKLPMNRSLRELEGELSQVRGDYQNVTRLLDSRTLDLNNLRTELQQRRDQSGYLSNLLGEFGRSFESRLHVTEKQRYDQKLAAARLALENTALPEAELFDRQLDVVDVALDELADALGGMRFEGQAVADGVVKPGTFVLLGPTALFRSADGQDIGAAEERLGSQEPTVIAFGDPQDREAAAQLVLGTGGSFPLDTTLGNAQKVESIQETWWEHVKKGGPVMIPMAVLAGAALLVVLLKWLSMAFVRRPSQKQMAELLDYVDGSDYAGASSYAATLSGPAGRMLAAGASHLGEPRELVEEVMFEKVMTTRLSLQGWLPFVAICATSAPLLGLLGTVTGIMKTFALMTEFGTGDPKTLSSGISEALITTENGLVIAIPSLLLHAFLSRKAKGIVDGMEKMAVQFMNRVRTPASVGSHDSIGVA